MALDTSVVEAMLKVITDGPLMDAVVTKSRVIDLFEQNSDVLEGPNGRYIETALLFGYNEAIGFRGEHGAIPIPGAPATVNGRVKLKKAFASAQMTRNVMATAVKGRAAFANWAEVELTKTEKALRSELDRVAIGFGAGVICRIDGSPSGSTINIDAPYGLPNDTKGWLPGIRRGMRLVAAPAVDGSGMRAGGRSVLVLTVSKDGNSGGGTITIQGSVPSDWTDNDYLFRGDDFGNNAPENGVEVEPMGLLGMIDDGDILPVFQNIDRTVYDEWKAQVIDASAAPYSTNPTETLLMRIVDDADELGDGEISHVLTTKAIFRNLYVQIKAQNGFGATQSVGGKLKAGMKGVQVFAGDRSVEVRALPKLPPGKMFGIDSSTLRRYHLSDFQWDDTSGSIFKQVQTGQYAKDEFWAYGRMELELGCTMPQRNVRVDGLSETAA